MDSTDYENFFITRDSLEEAEISEEKIKKILNGEEEIAFDDFGCEDDFHNFLKNLVEKKIISEEESELIYDYSEKRVLEKFLEEEEIEKMDESFEQCMDDLEEGDKK